MNTLTKDLIKGVAVGLFASWIKSLAEPPLQKLGEKEFPPRPEELEIKGADVSHHPQNMPPAVLAKDIYYKTTGQKLSDEKAVTSMKWIHYGLGSIVGAVYVSLVNHHKTLKIEEGATAGAAVWALTHGSTVPALGLQGKVSEMPKSWWVWEFGSHVVFGIAMEQSRKLINKIF